MPCLAIHLAVAKKYLEKHKEDEKDFILGTIAPDTDINIDNYINGITNDKNNRHFGNNITTDSLIKYMKNKVDFHKFFNYNDLNSSFLRAYFLHLLCDYYFFGEYIGDERLKGLSFMEGVRIGYNDYDLITQKLIEKYKLTIPKEIEEKIDGKGHGTLQIIDEETVDRFINEMSNVDLEEEKKIVLK